MRRRRARAISISVCAAVLGALFASCGTDYGSLPAPGSGASFDAGSSLVDGPGGTNIGPDTSDAGTGADAADSRVPDAAFGSVGALSFDGQDDFVHLPAAPGGASEVAFSVELWFRSKRTTGSMFEVYDASGGADRFLSLNSGAVCFCVYASPTPNVQICTTATTYGDRAWHHAAGTLGSGGVHLYVDGHPAASSSGATASTFATDTDFRLGMGHTGFFSPIVYFEGDLDEVRVWSVERSAADIAANYKQAIGPSTPGLQGYWKLDETGAATVTKDATSGAHDGQLTNFSFNPSPWISP
jgi:hypothetical protein